jgi:FeS assembly SUF system regulator
MVLIKNETTIMLRLSKLTDYGTVIMATMARDEDRVFAATELAMAIGVATPTASKILKMLTRTNLLQSVRGAKGGYRLSRPAGEISIAQIIDAVEGPIAMTECSAIAGLCSQEGACSIRGNWQRVNQVILRALDQITLADMTRPAFQPVYLERQKSGARRQRAPA